MILERVRQRGIGPYFERASFGDHTVNFERHGKRAGRDVWTTRADVARRNWQLHDTRTTARPPPAAALIATAATEASSPTRRYRITQIPVHPMYDTGRPRSREFTDGPTIRSRDQKTNPLSWLRQMVSECGAVRRILRSKEVVIHIGHIFPVQHQRGARHAKQVRAFLGDGRRPLGDGRRVIKNPDAASMRAEHEVFGARMNDHVVVARCRQIGNNTRPVITVVVCDKERALRAQKQHVGAISVLDQTANGSIVGGQPVCDGCP